MTILRHLRRAGAKHAVDRGMRCEGRRFTYADLEGGSNAAARVLRAHGVERGDRVVLCAGGSLELVLAYLGVLKLGAVCVPTNPAYRERELSWILADTGAKAIVADAGAMEPLSKIDGIGAVLEVGLDESGPAPGGPRRHPFYQAVQKASVQPVDEIVEDDDLALILYTSGTTGRAKGAMLNHGNLVANADAIAEAFRWTDADVFVHALPLFHVHGLCVGLNGALATGCDTVLLPKFDAPRVLDELRNARATMFMGVPTMYARLLAAAPDGKVALPAMRLFVSGSAALASPVRREFEERFGHEILERYGMTETLITVAQPYDGPRRDGTVGRPIGDIESRIVDAEGRVVADGDDGELLVRGSSVGPGYWKNDEATAAARDDDGWFHTGDVARREKDDGLLAIRGRLRELIISGGYNIYPREVEAVLEEHPAVDEAAVYGVEDRDLGEAVAAVIVPAPGSSPTEPELQEYCRERLASYKKPRSIRLVDELPRNAMGKVQKERLREG